MTNSLFGGKPKRPKQEIAQPVQQIQQSNIADETTRKQLAKRRRATQLNQVTGPANVARKTLGAA
ncbi:hypothetical protein KAR91_57335 [Candidatus Pacearchaeota archaeon]|nr:hypothetical protein [Candidatus Pacearchaeota archaeon]